MFRSLFLFSIVVFTVPLLAAPGDANRAFNEHCDPVLRAFAETFTRPIARGEAKQRGLADAESLEFENRQVRLTMLRHQRNDAFENARMVLGLLKYFDVAQTKEGLSPERAWKDTMRAFDQMVRNSDQALPDPFVRDVPPKNIQYLKSVVVETSNLALFRFEVSKALSNLPLDKQIGKHSDELFAKAVDKGNEEAMAQRIVPTIPPGFKPSNKPLSLHRQYQIDQDIKEMADDLLKDPLTPEAFKNAIRVQIDFDKKYGLVANDGFRRLVLAAHLYMHGDGSH